MNGVTVTYIGNYFEWSNNVGTKYYYAGSTRIAVRVGATLNYLFSDHLGSASITADSAGNLAGEMRYTAFGETRFTGGAMPTSFRYTGQRLDTTTNMYWTGSRWYDPALGRFIQSDSVVPDKGNPQGLDRFAYVANNPVTRKDPGGHCWGVASFLRGTQAYGTTCSNLDMALTIVQSDKTSLGDKALAGAYIAVEGTAHVAVAAGVALLACSAIAPCAGVAEGALGIGSVASAVGDPSDEIQTANTLQTELFRFGGGLNGPTPGPNPKPSDFPGMNGVVGPEFPPLPNGLSTFANPSSSGLTGQTYSLRAGYTLPNGLGVIADGMDVLTYSTHPVTHHTIYPTVEMTYDTWVNFINSLPWEAASKIAKSK